MSPDDWIRQYTVPLSAEGDPVIMVYYEIWEDLFAEETAQAIVERQYTISQITDQIDEPIGDLSFFARYQGKPGYVSLSYFLYQPASMNETWAIVMPPTSAIEDLLPS